MDGCGAHGFLNVPDPPGFWSGSGWDGQISKLVSLGQKALEYTASLMLFVHKPG